MSRTLLSLLSFTFVFGMATPATHACTTGVASGKATADGRPLLWKNRDTKERNNQVIYSNRIGYAYVAVVNAGSTGSVWMGANEKGFCIENSVIKDMPRGSKPGLSNGSFMRHALAKCATVAEFETLLRDTNESGRSTMSNYGVIDADGGAAIFETGHNTFVKFDANDPKDAPDGYVVRSNFTMTGTGRAKLDEGGDLNDIYSGGRYIRADTLFREAAKAGKLDHRYVLRHCSRDLADESCQPLPGSINGPAGELPASIDTASTICRRTTVSVGVFHGVRPGEDPLLTTMWVMLGEPAFSIAVPCWVAAGRVAEPLQGEKRSPLCSAIIELRDAHYDEAKEHLQSARLPKLWARTWALENDILRETADQLDRWRNATLDRGTVKAYHQSTADRVYKQIRALHEQYVELVPVTP